MLKIPTFILGGLLILTGLLGYLMQDPGLSIKVTGPLDNEAKMILSDGTQTHNVDLGYSSSDSAGEQAYWLIDRLNTSHAKEASLSNYGVTDHEHKGKVKSFWYASSKGDTLAGLRQEAENMQNAGDEDPVVVEWSKVDTEEATIKFVYKNQAGNDGNVTLQLSNWKNVAIEPKPKPGEKLHFGKSVTAMIPAFIGIALILLVLLAERKPNARKHIMHLAVLIGLLGFFAVAKMIFPAVSEMNWLKGEPNGIIQTSMLKPLSMLSSAGILLIFVILCVISFVQARKEMAAQAEISDRKKQRQKGEGDDDDAKEKASKKHDSRKKEPFKASEKKEDGGKPKEPEEKESSAKKTDASPDKDSPGGKKITDDPPTTSKPEPKSKDDLKEEDKPASNTTESERTQDRKEGSAKEFRSPFRSESDGKPDGAEEEKDSKEEEPTAKKTEEGSVQEPKKEPAKESGSPVSSESEDDSEANKDAKDSGSGDKPASEESEEEEDSGENKREEN
ncbi:MAG: hypothetical protein CMI21_08365 [Opitutae bacterium]|nr:hypothetical protein [Opitutae bacterium]